MKQLHLVFLLIFNLSYSILSFSQNKRLENGKTPESEIHAAMNPLDSNNMVVGVIGVSDILSLSIYYTKDFGTTWKKSTYNGINTNYLQAADPVFSFDTEGNVYLVHLAIRASDEIAQTIMAKSADGGATWTTQVIDSDTDKPWIWIDTSTSSKYKNRKYISYVGSNIMLSSLDVNNLLLHPALRVTSSEAQKNNFSVGATNKNGDLFICYNSQETNGSKLLISSSKDGGLTFLNEYLIAPLKMAIFTGEKIIGIEDKVYNCPNIAIDQSGGIHHNRIYCSFTDEEAGQANNDPSSTVLDVYLCYSDDDGKTWSTPQYVHKNAPQGTQQFYSTLVVNNAGQVIVTWYDQRQSATSGMTDYYIAISEDGGKTFKERKLSSEASDFEKINLQNNAFSIGEYTSTVATKNNAIAFWADGRTNDGDINVFYSVVNLKDFSTAIPEVFALTDDVLRVSMLSSNPTSDIVKVNLDLNERMNLSYQLINEQGGIFYSSPLSTYLQGRHVIEFSLQNYPSGKIYVRFMDASNKVHIKSFPIIKI